MSSRKGMKPLKETHTSRAKAIGGNYYGTALRQPIGKIRDSKLDKSYNGKHSMGKPPRSLA